MVMLESWVSAEWMSGTTGKGRGMFPVNFVEIVEPLPSQPSISVSGFAVTSEGFSVTQNVSVCVQFVNSAFRMNLGCSLLLVCFFHLFWKRAFGNNWQRFLSMDLMFFLSHSQQCESTLKPVVCPHLHPNS